jgi:aminopeptidase
VHAPIETAELTRLIVANAYEAGAKYVIVERDDEEITRIWYENAAEDSFGYHPQWEADRMERFAEEGGSILHNKVPSPELFRGIDSAKVASAR